MKQRMPNTSYTILKTSAPLDLTPSTIMQHPVLPSPLRPISPFDINSIIKKSCMLQSKNRQMTFSILFKQFY